MTNHPWLPYLATEYIRRLKPQRVFEWGSGKSTLFFIKLPSVGQLVSIEHDPTWYNVISSKSERRSPDWYGYKLIPSESGEIGPDKSNPAHYKSGSTELGPVNFKTYASAIDDYGLFDLILIDGMARASCISHAFSHVVQGGCIVIDNTDREYYLEKIGHLFGNWESGWERIEFTGYGPILDYQWKTLFLINRRKGDYEG